MAKMMWTKKVVVILFFATFCLTVCRTAPADDGASKKDTPVPANGDPKPATAAPKDKVSTPVEKSKTVDIKDASSKTSQDAGTGEVTRSKADKAIVGRPTVPEASEADDDSELDKADENSEDEDLNAGFDEAALNERGNARISFDRGNAGDQSSGKVSDLTEQNIDRTPESSASSGSFMTYFVASVIILVIAYIAFHNRHKILAYIVEGRRSRTTGRRRGASGSSGGGATVEYSRLNNAGTDELNSAS